MQITVFPIILTKFAHFVWTFSFFVEDISLDDFLDDKRSENAVAMSLVALGEIATVLSNKYPEFVAQHNEIPWRYMRGMRNVIAHGYFELDFEVVYETAVHSIPALLRQIDRLITDITHN